MPLYGQSFTLSSASNNGLNAPTTGGGTAGPFTRQTGFLAYFEICDLIKNGGWTVIDPTENRGPYAYNGNQWVGYDDEDTIRTKVCIISSYCGIHWDIRSLILTSFNIYFNIKSRNT